MTKIINLEKTNIEGKYLVTYITQDLFGNFSGQKQIRLNFTEKEIAKLIPEAVQNKIALKSADKHMISASSDIEKRLSDKGHKVKVVLASAAIVLATFGTGFALGYAFNKAVEPAKLSDTSDAIDETDIEKEVVVMTEEVMNTDLKEHVAYLASKGLNVTEDSLASFYFVTNSDLFNKELTEELVVKGIIPDTTNKILDEYNATVNGIINQNINTMYSYAATGTSPMARADLEAKLINPSTFIINDLDRAFVEVLETNNVDIYYAADQKTAEAEFITNYDLMYGVSKTLASDSANELTAGGQYLVMMTAGIETTVHGAFKNAGNEVLPKELTLTKEKDLIKRDELTQRIEASREDMVPYISEMCDLLNTPSKTRN